MNHRRSFFKKKSEFLTLQQALDITGAKLVQNYDLSLKIDDVATLEKAAKNQISFLSAAQYFNKFKETAAGFCLIDEANASKAAGLDTKVILLVHKNPYFAYSQIANAFYEAEPCDFDSAYSIHPTAQIGEGTKIAPLAYIGKNVKIGKNCFVAPSACILDNCIIGDNTIINACAVISYAIIGNNCIIYNGAKIGQDGFGFAHNAGVNYKIIQLGIVEIGNDVEIGANSCVDRGAIENTKIGDGTKIDNLVQIGHNVIIGKGVVIAGCAAVAGSTKIGNYTQIGGNSSVGGHITVGDGVKIAGMSGVMRDVESGAAIGGIPSLPIRDWHRLNTKMLAFLKGPLKKDM